MFTSELTLATPVQLLMNEDVNWLPAQAYYGSPAIILKNLPIRTVRWNKLSFHMLRLIWCISLAMKRYLLHSTNKPWIKINTSSLMSPLLKFGHSNKKSNSWGRTMVEGLESLPPDHSPIQKYHSLETETHGKPARLSYLPYPTGHLKKSYLSQSILSPISFWKLPQPNLQKNYTSPWAF